MMCPYALRTGIRHYRLLVDDLMASLPATATEPLRAIIGMVEAACQEHEERCLSVDRYLWPTEPPQALLFLRIGTSGDWIYLLYDSESERTVVAEPVGLEEPFEARLRNLVQEIEAANPDRQQPVFISVVGVKGTPKREAEWLPASDTLRRHDPGLGPSEYRTIQVRSPLCDPSLHQRS